MTTTKLQILNLYSGQANDEAEVQAWFDKYLRILFGEDRLGFAGTGIVCCGFSMIFSEGGGGGGVGWGWG